MPIIIIVDMMFIGEEICLNAPRYGKSVFYPGRDTFSG
jgi:hypothetical protein